jgi:hypothetical protein
MKRKTGTHVAIKSNENVRSYLATSEESEDTTTLTFDDKKIDSSINKGRKDQRPH